MDIPELRMQAWETGAEKLTIVQLRNLAVLYRQTLAAFCLDSPPAIPRPELGDFRRLSTSAGEQRSPELTADVASSIDRRDIMLELSSSPSPPAMPIYTLPSARSNTDQVAADLRSFLAAAAVAQPSWRDPRIAFNAWRDAIEQAGLLVFQMERVALSEARGYSLDEPILPVIAVNSADSYSARSFTLLHELAHICLHASGLCDIDEEDRGNRQVDRIETLCNRVAAAALVPADMLAAHSYVDHGARANWDDAILDEIGRTFSVGKEVILRRLSTMGLASLDQYRLKRGEWQRERASEPRRKSHGAPPPYRHSVARHGKAFPRVVLESYSTGSITSTDAADYLHLKPKHFSALYTALSAP
jgi:Zn-dependent peptidase ImmA (M78 family)